MKEPNKIDSAEVQVNEIWSFEIAIGILFIAIITPYLGVIAYSKRIMLDSLGLNGAGILYNTLLLHMGTDD